MTFGMKPGSVRGENRVAGGVVMQEVFHPIQPRSARPRSYCCFSVS